MCCYMIVQVICCVISNINGNKKSSYVFITEKKISYMRLKKVSEICLSQSEGMSVPRTQVWLF